MDDGLLPRNLSSCKGFFKNRAVITSFYPSALINKYHHAVRMRVPCRFASVHHDYTNYPYAFILKDRRKFLWAMTVGSRVGYWAKPFERPRVAIAERAATTK